MDPSAAQLSRFAALTAAFADAAWAAPRRELQYVACDLISRRARHCSPSFVDDLERWVTVRSWDTVDALAHGVGDLVLAHPEPGAVMNRWIDGENFWLARVAILHQLPLQARHRHGSAVPLLYAPRRRLRVLHSEGHRVGTAGVREDGSGRRPRVRA